MRNALHRWFCLLGAATVLASGCAYNATGAVARRTLIFEFSVEGPQLYKGNNVAYYLVLDTDNDANARADAPLINGPAPLTFPYPDPRSYLPFVRDESAVLDREPVQVPATSWTEFFTLYEDGGQWVMWQGRLNADGTINERYRQLQQDREFGIKDGGKTVQITVPFEQLALPNPLPADFAQFEANLAVATRGLGDPPRGFVIDRWLQVQNSSFTIQTKPITQNQYDSVSGVTFPQNLAGIDPKSVNITAFRYRVVFQE